MAARIAREEPTKKPFEELQGQFNQLLDSFKNMLDNPEIKVTLFLMISTKHILKFM